MHDAEIHHFEGLIRKAFEEDCAFEDLTSKACVEDKPAAARIVLKQTGCIAGLRFLPRIFEIYDPRIETQLLFSDGQTGAPGAVLAELKGPARSLLSAERTALNFLQHLSGVATLTARCVACVAGTSCRILDTRKTLPGWRSLQKYAVQTGGGTNHRLHLADRILIKNNHLALNPSSVQTARLSHPQSWIQVEIGSPLHFITVIEAGANAILLDNMTPEQVRECVLLNDKKIYLEASGGITLDNLRSYAETGVDGISIGALTHSAPALDIALRIF